jgi:thiosulfate/3-mercaptopyruvate sulfurtransferase
MDVMLDEIARRLGEEGLVLLDVRSRLEYDGAARAPCDPRHGHIPGARNLPLDVLLDCRSAVEVRGLIGLPEGTEVVAYCHTGKRSGFAVQVLRGAGYDARNYLGSWHEWSNDESLPVQALTP